MTTTSQPPKQPGDRAPGFSLPAINREGAVSLDDYRGKQPVLVDRKSTRLNSSHSRASRMPSSA